MNQTEKVEQALQSIRPFLQKDGGDVELVEITKDNIVKVRLTGACESCSMNAMTLRAGIEEAVINSNPEIKSVQAV